MPQVSFPHEVLNSDDPFPSSGPLGRVPRFRRYYEPFRFPVIHPASLPLRRSAVPRCAIVSLRRPSDTDNRGLESLGCGTPIRTSTWREQDLPGSWRTLCARAPLIDPDGSPVSDHLQHSGAAFRITKGVGIRNRTFRGSITRPKHSLSTLRSAGYPNATQDSLPAAGLLCRAGFDTRRVPSIGFSSVASSSIPGFAWRTGKGSREEHSGGALESADPQRGDFRGLLYGVARNVARRIEERAAKAGARQAGESVHLDDLPHQQAALSKVFDRA